MTTTARHSYITWPEGTTQPNVGYNDLVDKLDVEVGLSVISRTTDAQPVSPAEGDTYLITGSATGAAWSTYSQHDIAIYRSSAWTAITPIKGQVVHVQDESDLVAVWNGLSWTTITSSTPLGKYDATTAPTANEDSGDGYSVGSLWCDITADKAYICLDATVAAAVWTEITQSASGVTNNYAATAAPTTGDDDGDGYAVGSVWCDTTNDKSYICLDASTGAAVWTEITYTGPLHKLDATTDPTANEDSGDGYSVGSVWVNVTDDKAYLCADATSTAAVWLRIDNVAAATQTESLVVAVSDETTDLTTGTGKLTFRMPYAFTLSEVRASVTTAPTGAAIQVDINEGGVSILSTVLSIDATEKTSTTAATAAVISDSSLADDAEITIDIDQVGSTIAGAGLKVTLIGTQT